MSAPEPEPEERERRLQWFEAYTSALDRSVVRAAVEGVTYRCPCCGFWTLGERGGYEICEVCFWEDDGQDDSDADTVRGGPNGRLSLTAARDNFRAFGACDPESRLAVRPPTPNESLILALQAWLGAHGAAWEARGLRLEFVGPTEEQTVKAAQVRVAVDGYEGGVYVWERGDGGLELADFSQDAVEWRELPELMPTQVGPLLTALCTALTEPPTPRRPVADILDTLAV